MRSTLTDAQPGPRRAMGAAALCAWASGLLFGLPGVYGTWYFAEHDQIWRLFDFPTYGGGPFEDAGIETTVPLLAAFVLVCAAEVVVGGILWQRRRAGIALSLVLLPVELAFWVGFALPFAFVFGAARTVLVFIARATLRRAREV